MFRVLLPGKDCRFTGPVRHRDTQPVVTPRRLHAQKPRLILHQLKHALGGTFVVLCLIRCTIEVKITAKYGKGKVSVIIRSTPVCRTGQYERLDQRRSLAFQRGAFRLKQGGDEKRMPFQLHRTNFLIEVVA